MNVSVPDHDDVWPRIVRHRHLLEHRLSELQGLIEGRRIARTPDTGLEHLARWLEQEETLWETWPIPELRNLLRPCLHPSWSARQSQVRPYIEWRNAHRTRCLMVREEDWADAVITLAARLPHPAPTRTPPA